MSEASIPLVVMDDSPARDEINVLLLAEKLYQMRSSCGFAMIKEGGEVLELVTEGIQRFDTSAVFCLTRSCLHKPKQELMPIGPYHILGVELQKDSK